MIVGQAHISYWPLDKLAKIIPQLLLIVKVVVHFLFTDSQMIYVQMRRYRVPVRDGAWPSAKFPLTRKVSGARLGIVHRREDTFWQQTLTRLAADFGIHNQPVEMESALLDRRIRWRAAPNVWHNSAIRTTLYLPIHALRRLFGKGRRGANPDA